MNAPLKLLAAALCGLLLGLPAAQADDYWPITDVSIYFGTEGNALTVSPTELTLQAGEIYRMVIINPSENTHVVAAPELAAMGLTISLTKGLAGVNDAAAKITAGVSVGPGQEIEWTFLPIEEGTYKLGCDTPVHAAAGMHAMIRVVHEVL